MTTRAYDSKRCGLCAVKVDLRVFMAAFKRFQEAEGV